MEDSDRISGDEVGDPVFAELDSIFDEIHIKRVRREVAEQAALMENFRIVGRTISGDTGDGYANDNSDSS